MLQEGRINNNNKIGGEVEAEAGEVEVGGRVIVSEIIR